MSSTIGRAWSSYEPKGMYQDAIDMVQKAMDLSGDRSKIAAFGRVYALAGRKDEALAVIDELKELSKERYISPYCFALIYASLDEKDQAVEWLQTALKKHVSELIYMKVDPYLDNLRSDPRFNRLLRQVELRTWPALHRLALSLSEVHQQPDALEGTTSSLYRKVLPPSSLQASMRGVTEGGDCGRTDDISL